MMKQKRNLLPEMSPKQILENPAIKAIEKKTRNNSQKLHLIKMNILKHFCTSLLLLSYFLPCQCFLIHLSLYMSAHVPGFFTFFCVFSGADVSLKVFIFFK